jgi:patatin-like phospholipase/acyl hydrolase
MPAKNSPCYRILSIDGGGVRGLIPAIWLEQLEKQLGGPLHEHFDLIVGTSTGSILAASIAAGQPASQAVEFYQRHSATVFPAQRATNLIGRVREWYRRLQHPKHASEGLEKVLSQIFDPLTLADLKTHTMLTTFNLLNRRALMLKSWQPQHHHLKLADACRASSAAPTFFAAYELEIGHARLPLIDGGVVAGSPSAVGLTEAVRLNRLSGCHKSLDQYIVVSLGTGVTDDPISAEQGKTWGLRHWAAPLFDIVFDGSRQVADYHCRHLLGPGRYFRLQTRLEGMAEQFDDASPDNMNAIAALAEHWLQQPEGREQIAKLVAALKSCALPSP